MKLANLFSLRAEGRASALAAVLAATVGLVCLPGQTTTESLSIPIGRSFIIDYPEDIGRISTTSPEIADPVVISTREILVNAKGLGTTTMVVWSKTNRRTFYNISVEQDLEPIRRALRDTFPNENITVQAARDSVSLNGTVSSKEVSDHAAALAASLAKAVVNNMQIAAQPVDKQIMLRVKFAELNRNASKSFGVNLLSTGALNTPGAISTGQFTAPRPSNVAGQIPGSLEGTASNFSLTDALNLFAFRPDLNLAATVRALQAEGVLQILAEPNLITSNGKAATFLVGGEFPVPILQGGANSGAVTVQFREFGIRLSFTPQLTTHDTLKMHVRPEVSTLDFANAVTLSGFLIPALSSRRMETDIELGPGQSFVIGGLVDDRVTENMSKIPGLANIPLLGVLFRSKEERKSKTELIVLVTPEIVDPLNPSDPKPGPVFPKEFLPPTSSVPGANPAGAQNAALQPGKDPSQEIHVARITLPATSSPMPIASVVTGASSPTPEAAAVVENVEAAVPGEGAADSPALVEESAPVAAAAAPEATASAQTASDTPAAAPAETTAPAAEPTPSSPEAQPEGTPPSSGETAPPAAVDTATGVGAEN